MRGSITKKHDKYYPIVFLGRDSLTNKKKYKWGHGYVSRKDAEKELRQLLNAYDSGDDSVLFIGHKDYSTFNEVFQEWKELVKSEGLYESGTSYDTCIGNIKKQRRCYTIIIIHWTKKLLLCDWLCRKIVTIKSVCLSTEIFVIAKPKQLCIWA